MPSSLCWWIILCSHTFLLRLSLVSLRESFILYHSPQTYHNVALFGVLHTGLVHLPELVSKHLVIVEWLKNIHVRFFFFLFFFFFSFILSSSSFPLSLGTGDQIQGNFTIKLYPCPSPLKLFLEKRLDFAQFPTWTLTCDYPASVSPSARIRGLLPWQAKLLISA